MTLTLRRGRPLFALAVVVLLSVLAVALGRSGLLRAVWPTASGAAPVATRDGTVEIPAIVNAAGFHRKVLGMPGYHLIVWKGGRAASAALFQAEVTDLQVLEALEALGARPGDNLPMATWEERGDPSSKAPDRIIAGPVVEILVRVPGRRQPLTLSEILEDADGRGFEMRFGGHRANIPRWKSGCVACLYSCPGSKVGNARYTVRDYERNRGRFRVRKGVLPRDGSRVMVVLRRAD